MAVEKDLWKNLLLHRRRYSPCSKNLKRHKTRIVRRAKRLVVTAEVGSSLQLMCCFACGSLCPWWCVGWTLSRHVGRAGASAQSFQFFGRCRQCSARGRNHRFVEMKSTGLLPAREDVYQRYCSQRVNNSIALLFLKRLRLGVQAVWCGLNLLVAAFYRGFFRAVLVIVRLSCNLLRCLYTCSWSEKRLIGTCCLLRHCIFPCIGDVRNALKCARKTWRKETAREIERGWYSEVVCKTEWTGFIWLGIFGFYEMRGIFLAFERLQVFRKGFSS